MMSVYSDSDDEFVVGFLGVGFFLVGVSSIAYLFVHIRAFSSYFARFVLHKVAMSTTSGSSGLGSVSIEQIDKSTAIC